MKTKVRNTINHIIYTIIQLSFGICQNALGILLFLILTIIKPNRKRFYYHGAIASHWKFSFSMGLGMFIFFGHSNEDKATADAVLVHEYGHTIQSMILGPLFMFVIAIPSVVWAFTPYFINMRKEKGIRYIDFYPERGANTLGAKILKAPTPVK